VSKDGTAWGNAVGSGGLRSDEVAPSLPRETALSGAGRVVDGELVEVPFPGDKT